MKTQKLITIAIALLAFASTDALAQAKPIVFTEKDREFALKYMNDTKADYIEQLKGVSNAQLNFRAAEGRWTVAEIAEHITVVEEALFGMMTTGMMKAEPAKCENPFRVRDAMLIGSITNRIQRAQAPEQVQPNGRWKTVAELASSFEKRRNATIDYMKNNKIDLRNRFGASPLGTVDAFQQILFIIGHSERHLAQLKEVKTDAGYPKK